MAKTSSIGAAEIAVDSRQTDGEKPKRKQSAAQLANLTGGSRKNIPNKFTAKIKDMIVGALDRAGGESYLLKQAKENPNAFLSLVAKVLPTQLTGEGDGPIQTQNVTEDREKTLQLVAQLAGRAAAARPETLQ